MKIYIGASLMALSWHLLALPVAAETAHEPASLQETMRIEDAQDGALLFRTSRSGQFIKAPMVATDADIHVSGPIIRTTVSQTFENTSDQWVEGVYVFPLPEGAAVDRLKMVIGGRMIEGQIKEKQEAKRVYEAAKSAGKKASLLTQERPNMFTTSVANIGPGESVSIQIEYQDKARIQDGVFSLRFPMTVAPRFSPPRETVKLADADGGVSVALLDPVLDRARISPPVMPPSLEPESYIRLPVNVSVSLDAGFPLADVSSPYHEITQGAVGAGPITISLKDGPVPANKDFKLEWQAQPSNTPYSRVFTETIGGYSYAMAMLTPAKPPQDIDVQSHDRESLFVIDTSGSMGGVSISQARAALLLGLSRLGPNDRFNITRFSSGHSSVFTSPVPANAENLTRARRYVKNLDADGGTQMVPALEAVLHMKASPVHVRQIIFITDGAIGNETEMFSVLKHELNNGRFFPVGIGSAPNSHFMSRAAKFGRGTYVQIGKVDEVQSRMATLFKAIDNPVLTDIQTGLPQTAETYPVQMPDLYDGEPVVFVAKMPKGSDLKNLSLKGKLASADWAMDADISVGAAKGIGALWAREKIASLEDQRFDRANAAAIDKDILSTALRYQLVSRLTSLVAVDVTPSRPTGEGLTSAKVPTKLPEGWDFAKVSGVSAAKPAAPSALPAPAQMRAVPVPGTASPHNLLILLGALLMALAHIFKRRAA